MVRKCSWDGNLLGTLCRGLGCRLSVQDGDMAAGLQLVLPVDDNLFVRGKSAIDQRLTVAGLRNRNRSPFDGAVGLDHVGIEALLALLNGSGRNRQTILPRIEQQPRIDQFPRPQPMRGVWKFGLELDRAGRLQNLVIDEIDLADIKLDLVVLAVGKNLQRSLVGHMLLDLRQISFWKREDRRDWLDLGHDNQTIGGRSGG